MDPYPKIPTRTIMVMIGKVNLDLLPALFTLVTHYQEHPMEKYYNIIAFLTPEPKIPVLKVPSQTILLR